MITVLNNNLLLFYWSANVSFSEKKCKHPNQFFYPSPFGLKLESNSLGDYEFYRITICNIERNLKLSYAFSN